jgi:hypothetical protein
MLLLINSFNIRSIMHILGYNTMVVATFYFRRQGLTVVKSTAWLYVQQTYLYSAHKLGRAKRAYFFQNPATHRLCRRKLLLQNLTPFIPRRNVVDLPVSDATPCLRALPQRWPPSALHAIPPQGRHYTPRFSVPHDFKWVPNISTTTRRVTNETRYTTATCTRYHRCYRLRDPAVEERNSTRCSTIKWHKYPTTIRQQTYDVDPLWYAQHSSVLQEKRTHWFAITVTSVCAAAVVNSYAQLYNSLPLLQPTMYRV